MSLRDRLKMNPQALGPNANGAKNTANTASAKATLATSTELRTQQKGEHFEAVKTKVHNILVDKLNLDPTKAVSKEDVNAAAQQILDAVITTDRIPMSRGERELLLQELEEEILGLGPLEPLMKDPTISDILINGPKNVFVERGGKLQRVNVSFKDNDHLMHVIDRIVSSVGRRVDEKTPLVDSRMLDGSRFNAVIPPLAIDGPSLSIRKFKQDAGTLEKLLGWKSMTPEMVMTLEACVRAHLNIIVSGGTGAGKTTLLNSLSGVIAPDERIVTIEDSAEIQLQQEHVVRLETRPPNIEGEGAISARDLLVNSLRMRPDRIIVGECRGGESLDMLQAMNTGHDGSLTTLHANSPRDAISRIETMCMMNPNPLPEKTIRQQIASAVHIIVQASRLQDGSRKVTSITEVVGMEGNTILLQEIFRFNQIGVENGKVIGHHEACGVRPKFAEKLAAHGIELPNHIFNNTHNGEEEAIKAEKTVSPAESSPATLAERMANARQEKETAGNRPPGAAKNSNDMGRLSSETLFKGLQQDSGGQFLKERLATRSGSGFPGT